MKKRIEERWFAWLMRQASRWHEPLIAHRKRTLLADLRGDVLEIGAGAGVNLKYLNKEVRWTGYEPNRILAAGIPSGQVIAAEFAEPAGPYDAIIATLVLCSVAEPHRVLRSIADSLRPRGRFIFIEHVGGSPGSPLRRSQDRWQRVWSCCAGGCRPNRDTEQSIREAGFEIESIERFDLPMWLAGPHIAGVAVKRLELG